MTFLDRIPAHIRYPGLVMFFLGGSIIGQVFLFRAAFSNGGPQIEENYYERAMGDVIVARAEKISASRALGWSITVEPHSERDREHIVLAIKDANGAPLQMASGEVEVRRPHLADQLERAKLEPGSKPGEYRFTKPLGAPGLWDLEVLLEHPDAPEGVYIDAIRSEW